MTADLHLHTDCSDGKLSVIDTVKRAKENKISLISITDHDSLVGVKDAINLSSSFGLTCISGIELSCRNENINLTFPNDISIHVLGYNIDFENKELNSYLKQYHLKRKNILSRLISQLRDNKFDIKYEDIFVIAGNQMRIQDVINHINASFMSKEKKDYLIGIVNEYYDQLFMLDCPLSDAIAFIKDAGGIPVLAHAFFSYRDYDIIKNSHNDVSVLLDKLCQLKIDGLEVFYSRFSQKQMDWLFNEAMERKLMITAGSDFHGTPLRNDMISHEIEPLKETIKLLLNENRYRKYFL